MQFNYAGRVELIMCNAILQTGSVLSLSTSTRRCELFMCNAIVRKNKTCSLPQYVYEET